MRKDLPWWDNKNKNYHLWVPTVYDSSWQTRTMLWVHLYWNNKIPALKLENSHVKSYPLVFFSCGKDKEVMKHLCYTAACCHYKLTELTLWGSTTKWKERWKGYMTIIPYPFLIHHSSFLLSLSSCFLLLTLQARSHPSHTLHWWAILHSLFPAGKMHPTKYKAVES